MRGRVKVRGRALVVEAGAPKGLVRVDVADAADQRLVEQGPFDGRALAAQGLVEGLVVEERVQRVAGDVRDDVGQTVRGGVVQRQAAEGALVDEAEFGAERRPRTGPGCAGASRRARARGWTSSWPLMPRWARIDWCGVLQRAATGTCRGGWACRCGGP